MIITIPAELWGLITHILVYLWGLLLAGAWWDDRKRNHKPVLPIYFHRWIFPTISAVHFFSFAFLAITFWSKEYVMTGMHRRPYNLRICDNVTGTLFRMRSTCILLDCPHEQLVSLRTQNRQLVFPSQYEDSPTRLRTFLNQPYNFDVASFVAKCLALLP